jgi:hypothetical protein
MVLFTFIYLKSIINTGANVILRQNVNESNDEFGCPPKTDYGEGLSPL